jgi:hypothetical protein
MTKTRLVFLALFATAGCGSQKMLAHSTSGHTGCHPDEIEIVDHASGYGALSWTALCRGEIFYCSRASSNVSCKAAR